MSAGLMLALPMPPGTNPLNPYSASHNPRRFRYESHSPGPGSASSSYFPAAGAALPLPSHCPRNKDFKLTWPWGRGVAGYDESPPSPSPPPPPPPPPPSQKSPPQQTQQQPSHLSPQGSSKRAEAHWGPSTPLQERDVEDVVAQYGLLSTGGASGKSVAVVEYYEECVRNPGPRVVVAAEPERRRLVNVQSTCSLKMPDWREEPVESGRSTRTSAQKKAGGGGTAKSGGKSGGGGSSTLSGGGRKSGGDAAGSGAGGSGGGGGGDDDGGDGGNGKKGQGKVDPIVIPDDESEDEVEEESESSDSDDPLPKSPSMANTKVNASKATLKKSPAPAKILEKRKGKTVAFAKNSNGKGKAKAADKDSDESDLRRKDEEDEEADPDEERYFGFRKSRKRRDYPPPSRRPGGPPPVPAEDRISPWGEIWWADRAPVFDFGETIFAQAYQSVQITADLLRDNEGKRPKMQAPETLPWQSRFSLPDPKAIPMMAVRDKEFERDGIWSLKTPVPMLFDGDTELTAEEAFETYPDCNLPKNYKGNAKASAQKKR